MTSDSDDEDGMIPDPSPLLDDDVAAFVADDDPPDMARHLASFVDGVRAAGDGEPPTPSPALARLLAAHPTEFDEIATARSPQVIALHRARRSRVHATRRAAAVALAVKLALGTSAAAAAVASAGALHVLPGGPGTTVRKAIESVTPFDLGESPETPEDVGRPDSPATADGPSTPDGTAGEHGETTSQDATGESDGEPGVDGPAVADHAPAVGRPTDPGSASPPSTTPPAPPTSGTPAADHPTGGAGTATGTSTDGASSGTAPTRP